MRAVTGFLWIHSVWFRWLVISWCVRRWIGHRWLAVNTPLVYALRLSALDRGAFDEASALSNYLRQVGEL